MKKISITYTWSSLRGFVSTLILSAGRIYPTILSLKWFESQFGKLAFSVGIFALNFRQIKTLIKIASWNGEM